MLKNKDKSKDKKKQLVGSLLIVTLLMVSSLSVIFIILPEPIKGAPTDFARWKQITIESDYLNDTLENFPFLIHDDTGTLLGNVLVDCSDIAFYDVDNNTQYNHEIDKYDESTGELWVWINITLLNGSTDTIINMCYDDSDGDYPEGGHNPTDVWDTDYLAVWHFNNLTDATSNNIDLTNTDCVAGKTGMVGDTYNWTSLSYMSHGTFLDSYPNSITIESWFQTDDYTNISGDICGKRQDTTTSTNRFLYECGTTTGIEHRLYYMAGGTAVDQDIVFLDSNDWYYSGFTSLDSGNVHFWLNTTTNTSGPTGVMTDDTGGYDWAIGARSNAGISNRFHGLIDEMRISQIRRNESWIWATYNCTTNVSGFITLGTEEAGASTISLILNSDTFTHAGQWGDTVYSNETGTVYEWAEFDITHSGSDVEYIRINITDIDANITSSNCSYQFTADNTSWNQGGTWQTGVDGGFTIILNNTNWLEANGCYPEQSNPFPFTGDGSIWMVERITIPSGIGNETYSCTNRSWDSGYYS